MKHEKLIIMGSGPAGLTAAIYAARANLKPLVIEGFEPGGQLTLTSEVENFPGFPEGVMGPELMENFKKQAERFGARFVLGNVEGAQLSKRPFEIKVGAEGFSCDSFIIASGASARWLGIESEKKYRGKGVSTCATCDGAFYRNMEVAVVGGGDSAMEEANFLTRFCSKIYVIHRREEFRASKIMLERAQKNPKIEFIMNAAVKEIQGAQTVEKLILESTRDHSTRELAVQGLFVAIGHVPNTTIFKDQLPMNEQGYLLTRPNTTETEISGVFSAGDVHDFRYRQAITAAGSGCRAAMDAEKYLESLGH
ncbi:MAG: thioredoxin-disulfide reductase [Deltaproteobacteria bacterium CG11_big_fil_rev_8_21_14_0_20_45_16]|nr:MAG: thioredoxin-disulfide reductase [Deltaproteobacteria bacterium CG11_big_fil_rev_8_21_14_0_20_45_16]